MILFLILLLAVFQCTITQYLVENPDYYQLGLIPARLRISAPCAWDS